MTRRPSSNRSLAQIAQAIKALEKRGIRDIVEIGKLLHEAEQKCEYGDYMKWIEENFDFSHDTSRNYRAAFQLARNPNCSDFARWNISVAGFYLIAATMDKGDVRAAKAVIREARKRRVSSREASKIIYEHHLRRRSGNPYSPPVVSPSAHSHPPAATRYNVVVDHRKAPTASFDHRLAPVVDDKQQQWQNSVRAEAEHAIEAIELLIRDFLDWGRFEAPSDLVELVNRATSFWRDLDARLDKSKSSSSVKAKADRAGAKSKPRSGGES
jgi:hypothetical protein